jgi:hypothetical protein
VPTLSLGVFFDFLIYLSVTDKTTVNFAFTKRHNMMPNEVHTYWLLNPSVPKLALNQNRWPDCQTLGDVPPPPRPPLHWKDYGLSFKTWGPGCFVYVHTCQALLPERRNSDISRHPGERRNSDISRQTGYIRNGTRTDCTSGRRNKNFLESFPDS